MIYFRDKIRRELGLASDSLVNDKIVLFMIILASMLVMVLPISLTTFAYSEGPSSPVYWTICQKGSCYFSTDSYNNTFGPSANASGIIQNALNSLTAERTWKERVILQGVFTISSTLRIPSYTILDCSEAKLIAAPGLNAPLITNNNLTSGDQDIELDVSSLDGNAANQNDTSPYPYGLYIGAKSPNEVYNVIIQGNFMNTLRENIFLDRVANAYLDVFCSGSKNYEGVVLRASHDVQARISAWNNAQADVYLDYCWDCQITAITSGGKYGLGLRSSIQNQISAITESASIDGIFISEGSDGNVISGTSCHNARYGIWVSNSCNEEIRGQYDDNGGSGVALCNVNRSEISVNSHNNGKLVAQSDGIYGYDCFHLIVMSSHIYDSQCPKTQDCAIVSAGASDYWELIYNDLVDGGLHSSNLVGSNNIIEGNLGFASKDSGTVTVASPKTAFYDLAKFFPFSSLSLLGVAFVMAAFFFLNIKRKYDALVLSIMAVIIWTFIGLQAMGWLALSLFICLVTTYIGSQFASKRVSRL